MPTDLTIPNEIARQIGRQAFFMMGTRDKIGDERSLMFDIKGINKYNKIKVYLDAKDTYTVTFIKVGRAPEYKITQEEVFDVHVDNLHSIISERTGLALNIPRVVGFNA